jgi:hypothetical protein
VSELLGHGRVTSCYSEPNWEKEANLVESVFEDLQEQVLSGKM